VSLVALCATVGGQRQCPHADVDSLAAWSSAHAGTKRGTCLLQTHATLRTEAGSDKGSDQGSAAVVFEEAYHYDVEILSGDLKEQDIRDIYDVLFEVKAPHNMDKIWELTTPGLCVSLVDPPKSLGAVPSETCGRDKVKELYGDQIADEHERPIGNKITVDGNVLSYQTCESTSGDEFGSSKSLQNDEKAWVTKSGTKLLIEKFETSNFVEGSC